MPKPVVVAITGASGAVYGVELLKALRELGRPAHAVVSRAGELTLELELGLGLAQVRALAAASPAPEEIGAAMASGSFATAGMIVAPCTIKTLSAVANSYTEGLIARAADVHLKERRPLVLMVRETPLHAGHLELMLKAARLGATILPPAPAFYHRPSSIQELVRHTVGRALSALGLENDLARPWQGA